MDDWNKELILLNNQNIFTKIDYQQKELLLVRMGEEDIHPRIQDLEESIFEDAALYYFNFEDVSLSLQEHLD